MPRFSNILWRQSSNGHNSEKDSGYIDKNIFEIKLDYVYTYCMDGNQEGRKRYGYEKKAAPLHAVKRFIM